MTEQSCYTYRDGQKLYLHKSPSTFVIRALADELGKAGLPGGEQVSTASTRLTVDEVQLEALMAQARAVAPAHHAYRVADSDEEFLITDRVFITFKPEVDDEVRDRLVAKYALWERERYSPTDFLYQLSDATGMNPVKLVVKLNEDEKEIVASAENDLNYTAQAYAMEPGDFVPPTDPSYDAQWHLHTHPSDTREFDPRASARCEDAWRALDSFGDPGVVVGVTDDGCKLDHRDFNGMGKFAGWGYFEGSDLITHGQIGARRERMYRNGFNHGTACAGVIAAEADSQLTVGAAPGCRLLPIKWPLSPEGFLYIGDARMMRMLAYVGDRVDVLSNSWGMSPVSRFSTMVKNRVRQLAANGGRRGKGIIFLWAAGNENCPIHYTADTDVPYTNGIEWRGGRPVWVGVRTARRFVHDLTELPGVMYVAALTSEARRSHYSNYGPGVDLCAPSNNINLYQRASVRGRGITTTTGSSVSGTRSNFGGTSSATPLTAGVAALVISANPKLSGEEVISTLKRTAEKNLNMRGYPKAHATSYDPDPRWDVSPIPPFDRGDFEPLQGEEGSWSPWFGHGRVDAARAVEAVLRPRRLLAKVVTEPLVIPDADPKGVTSIAKFEDRGSLCHLRVQLDVRHTYVGDLIVVLTAPNGRKAVLHNRTGGSRDNLQLSLASEDHSGLGAMLGSDIKGTWSLWLSDRARFDRGTLQRWSIQATVS